jgi:hypothetical protein
MVFIFTNTLQLQNCERARIKERIAATAVKARVRSGSALFLQHAQQGFETVAAKLRPSSKLSKVQVRSQLRTVEAATLLVAS